MSPLNDSSGQQQRVGAYAWYVLGLLTLFHAIHTIDRSIAFVILEPLKREFGLSDGQAGALSGLAHGAAFALTSIPISWLADRSNRARLLSIMAIGWGSFTALCSFAQSVTMLFLARMGVGATEGGTVPACLSLISDYFPPHRRALALGIFFCSAAIGTSGAYFIGGVVAQNYGWRAAFLVASAPAFLCALLAFFTLREPKRGVYDQADFGATKPVRPTISAAVGHILRAPALLCGIGGLTLCVATLTAFYAFSVSFLMRGFDLSLTHASLISGLATGPAHAFGSVIGGWLADRVVQGRADRIGYFPAAAVLLSLPAGALMLLGTTLPAVITGLLLMAFLGGAWLPQGFATPLALTKPEIRASTVGFSQVFTNLIGTGMGPAFAGLVSDYYGQSLSAGLASMLGFYLLGASLFVSASRLAGSDRSRRPQVIH